MMDILAFGEVLWDVIDGVPRIGGAPFNFAAHAVRSGLKASVVSAVGNDELGHRALAAAERLGVDVSMIAVHPTLPTGTVNVTLENGIPSYEIVRAVAWDEITLSPDFASAKRETAAKAPRALYFGTLARRSPVSAGTLRKLLENYASSLVFFDVNLRQDYWSAELIEEGLGFTDILKVNDEEMTTLNFTPSSLFTRFPRLKTVIETRGKDGCRVTSRDGDAFDSPAVDSGPVVDTVGAGDSFSAAFISSVLGGKSLREAAEAGNRLAGWVASKSGAIPDVC